MSDPKTKSEWLMAMETAQLLLIMHDLVPWGLVNIERCKWILAEGERRGICCRSHDQIHEEFAALLNAKGVKVR